MNPVKILLSVIVAFVLISGTDYFIHEVWLKSTYAQDAGTMWRKEPVMSGIFIGHALVAVAFAMLWARIALGGAGIQCAVGLGFMLGLFNTGSVFIQNAVMPLREGLAMKWAVAGFAQSILVAIALFFVNRPTKSCPSISGK